VQTTTVKGPGGVAVVAYRAGGWFMRRSDRGTGGG
jgi:hypothetical protein